MGGHHEARDGRPGDIWRVLLFLWQRSEDPAFYGEARVKFRAGQVVGQVHAQRDYLVEDLPMPTPEQMTMLSNRLAGVS
jgi:hypothetical protein